MKKKSKLDPKAIKQFFIDHTEKIAIGVVGLLFLYFTYSAVMLQANDSYKNEPKKLADAVQAAERTMTAGPATKTPVTEVPIPPIAAQIERFKKPEDPNKHSFDYTIYPGVFAQRNPRGTPAVIPVEELRAVAGRCALGSRDNNAGTVGQRFVVVTGLVPNAKQLAEYKSKFETASYQGEHDVPEYTGFLVQRAEVAPGAAGEPNWEKAVTVCNENSLGRQLEKWSGTSPEVVESKYIFPGLTSQLPPRAIGEWGDEVAHPGEIKLIPQEERDQKQAGGQAGPLPANPRDRRFSGRGAQMPSGRGDGRFSRGSANPEGRGPAAGPPRAGGDLGGDDLLGGNGGGAKDDVANNKPAEDAAQVPPYYLLRYFDFDVEPGKQYAYRVYLLLRNPNDGLQESVLFDPRQHSQHYLSVIPGKERANEKNQVSDLQIGPNWSNSCQSTKLPGSLRLIAGPVEPPKTPSPTEVTGDVRFLGWDEATGANRNAQRSGLYRGTVLNFDDVDWHNSEHEKVESNNILADITGGEALTPRDRDKIHCPGAMLFLDEAGNLVISDEMSQAKEWTNETKEPERPNPGGVRGQGQGPERRAPRMGGRGGRGGGLSPTPPDSSLPDMAPHGGR